MLQAIICDFDFTLADSAPGIIACVNTALQGLGLPEAPAVQIRGLIGLSLARTFQALTGLDDPALAAAFTERFVAHADQVMHGLTTVYPWVAETVRALRAWDCRLGIVSSKYRYRIERILHEHALAAHFEVIVGGEDVAQPKPDPEALHLALRRLGVTPTQVLYIGDHPVDAEAASRVGVPFMAVLTGTSEVAHFAPYPVQRFLADFSHVLPQLPVLDSLRHSA